MNGTLLLNGTGVALLFMGTSIHAQVMFTQSSYSVGEFPSGMVTGDFDSDGDIDIAAVAYGPLAVKFLDNDGRGGFVDGGSFLLPKRADAGKLIASDMNADGLVDLVVALPNLQRVMILVNGGRGVFAAAGTAPTGPWPHGMAIGDLDRDGDLDIAVANSGSNTVSLIFNAGRFRFRTMTLETGRSPRHVALGDLDSDRDLDLITSDSEERALSVFRNSGKGEFGRREVLRTGTDSPDGLVVEDWDGDGDLDIAAAANSRGGGCAWMFLNQRDGFGRPSEFDAFGLGTSGLAYADFNRDGLADFITADRGSNSMTVFVGRGNGMFEIEGRPIEVGAGPDEVLSADFDQDGDMDAVTMNADDKSVTVLYNMTRGGFGP
jgi:hypothetical protein